MAQAREAVKDGRYADGVRWNESAMHWLNWDWRVRVQYPMTLSALIKQADVELSPRLQDYYYGVGASASPHLPALLLIRFEDLYNTQRNADEALEVYTRLKTQTPIRATQELRQIEGFVE